MMQNKTPEGYAITTDYTYDTLNRLDVLVQFVDSDGNGSFNEGTDTMVASYDYPLDAAGNRISATETTIVDGTTYTYEWSWTYDALNRLTEEVLDASDDSLDYTDTFTYDLAGNRLTYAHDTLSDGMTSGGDEDTLTTYAYDANDRLTVEVKDNAGDDTKDRYTEYSYNHTTQASKTTWQGTSRDSNAAENPLVSSTTYTYNELGRLSQVTETTYTDGVDPQTKTTDYAYNTQGLRVTEVITDANGEVTTKQYLFDTMNPTGYAQVLEEYINDQLAYSYTLGHDVISVAKAAGIEDAAANTAATVYHLLTDGHGSTRLLANLTATTVALAQQYLYNAYGEMLSSEHLAIATNALTSLLYSGEWTNANGTQYLRARFYDPATGRFNRLDPFAGNQNDPQSLHKYLYTHGNPIMGIDPTGMWSLPSVLATVGIISLITAIELPAFRGALLAGKASSSNSTGDSIWTALFKGQSSWSDFKEVFNGYHRGSNAGAYNVLDVLTFRTIAPLNEYSDMLWKQEGLDKSWVGITSNGFAWAGTTALYAAGAVWAWSALGGGTMDIAVSKGASPFFIHVEYGVGGTWQSAVLGTGSSGLGGMTIVNISAGSIQGVQLTGIPVLYPQLVLAGAEAGYAFSCVNAAINAFARGWGL